MRLFRAELYKTRHRLLWLLPVSVPFALLMLCATNSYLRKPEVSGSGYYTVLFHYTMYNTIFLPLILAALASRICDAENKGNTYKLLCTMQQKHSLFHIKLLLGALYILLLMVLEALTMLFLGKMLSFTQPFPTKYFLIFIGVLFLVSFVLFLMQLVCSLMLSNQLIPLFIGLLGSLVGLFSAFFPIGDLAAAVPWGYYLIGMPFSSMYDEQARVTYFYEVPFRWGYFACFLVAAAVLYFVGKRLFLKKEV